MGVMHTEPKEAPMDDLAAVVGQLSACGSAAITNLLPSRLGISVMATGDHEAGIGRVDFVLADLTIDPPANVIDRKDIDYSRPPKLVSEAWVSAVGLTAAHQYRVFFHVYDRTGVSLVAYDRRDFAPETTRQGGHEHV
jgi:hypothetical protein